MNKYLKLMLIVAGSLITLSTNAQQAWSKTEYLDEGNEVDHYPKVSWLKGEPIASFEKDKIYIIELWATWCIPCVEAMPHLNMLNEKFKNRNVVFIAQDVLESDSNKVMKFIEDKGEKYDFRFAFGGPEGSDFDQKWVKAAGVTAIPQTFIIQNNILVWITRPERLNEKVIQSLIDGKFSVEAAKKMTDIN